MDSSNAEKVYNRAYDQAFATGGKQSDWIKAGVKAVAEWRDAEVAELERQIQGWVKSATEAKDVHRAEVEVLREQLAAAEAVIERVRALATQFSENESYGDYTEGKEAAGDEVLDILTLTRGVVLAEIIREAKAEAWDSGHNSATMRTAQELLALLPQRKTAANPYRTGDTNA